MRFIFSINAQYIAWFRVKDFRKEKKKKYMIHSKHTQHMVWKGNGRQTADAKWWQNLTLALARWAKKKQKDGQTSAHNTNSYKNLLLDHVLQYGELFHIEHPLYLVEAIDYSLIELIWDMTTYLSRRLNILCIMFKIRAVWSPGYVWELTFHLHIENTCMTASYHEEGSFGFIELV